jgi:SPP1 gp7 family putative phage head morphogenesis protein
MRYAEEILAAKEANDRAYLTEMSKKNANLLLTQSMQAGIEVEDEAIKTVFKKAGIKKGKWVAEKDDITCSVCRDRDGKIYPIDSIPAKPHRSCRCYIVPYRETDSESR